MNQRESEKRAILVLFKILSFVQTNLKLYNWTRFNVAMIILTRKYSPSSFITLHYIRSHQTWKNISNGNLLPKKLKK